MYLLDVNVWLALAFDRHRHHEAASHWFSIAPEDSCLFCRLTQISFLRLATTPQVMAEDVLTLNAAWLAYDALRNDTRVAYADEPNGLQPVWRGYSQHRTFSPKVWNDAYLAAFASAADFELVTFDRGLQSYKQLRCTVLS
ncbi:MAG TPA: TA system VapC family ribonuclease toxin [Pirellulaceae bacterium]|nr:TA system VapC family ribonuclease toxin [Pirellulaceae bacterium]